MATSNPEVRCLEEYSQLTSVKNLTKIYFVRNAGGGQHGDPTVKKGWAMYFWDIGLGRWRKFAEEESLLDGKNGTFDPSVLDQYIKKIEIDEFIAKCNEAEARAIAAEAAAEDARRAAQKAQDAIDTLINSLASVPQNTRDTVSSYELYDMISGALNAAKKDK